MISVEQQYIIRMLPHVHNYGSFAMQKGAHGKASTEQAINDATAHEKVASLSRDLEYPCILQPEPPATRAKRMKQGLSDWTDVTKENARGAFVMTAYFLVYCFELLFGVELGRHARFRVNDTPPADGNRRPRVKLCCPYHLNTHGVITPTSARSGAGERTRSQYRQTPEKNRVIYSGKRTLSVIDGQYYCVWYKCPEVQKKYAAAGMPLPSSNAQVFTGKLHVSFLSSSGAVMATMPDEIKELYSHFILLGQRGMATALMTRALTSEQEWKVIRREIGGSYDMITKVRMDGYARFVAAEASGPTDM